MRPSWVEIDLRALATNVGTFSKLAAPARVCAVVKADGYGHGDVPVAEAALEAGAEWLAVALVEEGARLREAGISAPILLLSEPMVDSIGELVALSLTPTVYTEAFIKRLGEQAPEGFPVHLKVDTGMHRVGAVAELALSLAKEVASSSLRLEGAWTHFAVADIDPAFTANQLASFRGFLRQLKNRGIRPELVHSANTPATLQHPESHFDMVRVGLGLYGLRPAPEIAPEVELRPVMQVISQVSLVRRLPAGARPSYGRSRPLLADSWVATVPIGYADGVWRPYAEQGGEVLIGGVRRPLAGTVTMDQIVVDCGSDPVEDGSQVVLLGRQGSEEITADEWAAKLGTINYEIVCRIGPRMPRRYRR